MCPIDDAHPPDKQSTKPPTHISAYMMFHFRLRPSLLVALITALALGAPLQALSPELMVAEGVHKVLPGFRFNKRLSAPTEQDQVLLFSNGPKTALVTWTTGQPKTFGVPASPMGFTVYNTDGDQLSTLLAQDFNLNLVLANEPAIYVPQQDNAILQVASLAQTLQPRMSVRGPQIIDIECEFVNPMEKPLILAVPGSKSVAVKPGDRYKLVKAVNVGRSFEPMKVQVGASGIFQTVTIEMENPIMVDIKANLPRRLTLEMLNPTQDPFSGRMSMQLLGSNKPPFEFEVMMGPGESVKELQIPLNFELPLPQPVQLVITQPVGDPRQDVVLVETPSMQFVNVPGVQPAPDKKPEGWRVDRPEGAFADLLAGEPPAGAPWGDRTIILAYKFDAPGGWTRAAPATQAMAQIANMPSSVGFWVNSDGSGNLLSVRWRDADGKVYQPKPRVLSTPGWTYETFSTDPRMKQPISWDSLVYVQAASPSSGALMISGPVLTYQSTATQATKDTGAVEVIEDVTYGDPVRLDPARLQQVSGG